MRFVICTLSAVRYSPRSAPGIVSTTRNDLLSGDPSGLSVPRRISAAGGVVGGSAPTGFFWEGKKSLGGAPGCGAAGAPAGQATGGEKVEWVRQVLHIRQLVTKAGTQRQFRNAKFAAAESRGSRGSASFDFPFSSGFYSMYRLKSWFFTISASCLCTYAESTFTFFFFRSGVSKESSSRTFSRMV